MSEPKTKLRLRDDVQRLWDLVRFKRHELFCNDEIISREEYAALAEDHPAVERLETQDRQRQRIATLEAENAELRKYKARLEWMLADIPQRKVYLWSVDGARDYLCCGCHRDNPLEVIDAAMSKTPEER